MRGAAGAASFVISPHAVDLPTAPRPGSGAWTASGGASSTWHLLWSRARSADTERRSGRRSAAGERDLEADRLRDRRRRTGDHSAEDGPRPGLPPLPSRCPRCDRRTGACPRTHVHGSSCARATPVLRWAPRRCPAAGAGRTGRRHERSRRASPGPASRCMTRASHGRSSNGGCTRRASRSTDSTSRTHTRKRGDRVRRRGVPLVTRGQAGRRRPAGVARTTRMGGDRGRQGLLHRRSPRRSGSRTIRTGTRGRPTRRRGDGSCGREAQLARTRTQLNAYTDTQLERVTEAQLGRARRGRRAWRRGGRGSR